MYDVIVIGAGPSGLIAAGRAAELGGKVLIVEKMKNAGRKLLLTGNTRCNITNNSSESVYYKNIHPAGKFLKHAFQSYFSKDIVQLLEKQGVHTKIEQNNRVFPVSNKSKDVLQALLKWLKAMNVQILYKSPVKSLIIAEGRIEGVEIERETKSTLSYSKAVIICTGGMSYPATGSTGDGYRLASQAGHFVEKPFPALVPLSTESHLPSKLQGIALPNVKVALWINGRKSNEIQGEVLFTHYGLSGPAILNISRWVTSEPGKNTVELVIDLIPEKDEQSLDQEIVENLNKYGNRQLENVLKAWLPVRFNEVILHHLSIDGKKPANQVKSNERKMIVRLLKELRFKINGHRGYNEAVITAGGVRTTEIDSKTMESKLVKNLYFAGEVMNLDAYTGGFNLQIAYSTAWLAAESCMKVQ